jgi:hypothetical protein
MEFENDQRAFVDATMRPLGDDPSRREVLEEAVALASTLPAPIAGNNALTAADRMQRTAARFVVRQRAIRISMAVVGVVAAWFAVAGPPAWRSLRGIGEANSTNKYFSSMCCSNPGVPDLPDLPGSSGLLEGDWEKVYVMNKLTSPEASLIIGATDESDPVLRWRRVWESHPEDPAHFCAYAMAYRKLYPKGPPEMVATGERLDPGNGWFRLMAAMETLKGSIGDSPPPPRITQQERLDARAKGLPPPKRPAVVKPERIVIDPAAFDRGWQELDAALAMPRWDNQRRHLDAIRAGAWPDAVDYPEFCAGQLLACSQPEDVTSGWLDLKSLTEAFERAAEKGDQEILEALETRLKKTARLMGSGSNDMMRSLMTRNVTRTGALALSRAWTRIGETDRSKTWKDFADSTDPKSASTPPPMAGALTENRGSTLASSTALYLPRRSPDSAPVTEADLRGGRLAEYAMYERLMLHATALLFSVALGFLLLTPLLDRRALGPLPARLADLLGRRDCLRIFAIGVALPSAVYLLSTHPPGLVTRRYGITEQGFYVWLAQSMALVVAVILGTLQSIRRQLDGRAKFLALGWVGPDPGRLCFPAALLAMPLGAVLPNWMVRNQTIEMAGYANIIGLVGFPLLWLIWQAVGCFNGSPARKLHRSVLMHATAPFVTIALAATALAIPWVYAEEKACTKEIRYEKLGPDNTLFESRLEREYAAWIARDLLDHLEAVK